MPIRKVSFVPGEFYHVYNRGNSRQQIFLTEQNYERFMWLLYVANGTRPLDLREVEPECFVRQVIHDRSDGKYT